MSGFSTRVFLGAIASVLDEPGDQDVGARANSKGPVAPEPPAGVLVSGADAHLGPQQRAAGIELGNGEGVHVLCESGLLKVLEPVAGHLRVLDHGPPELADQPERDLIVVA